MCGIAEVQIFLVQVTVEKWSQDHYFSQKVLLVGTPNNIFYYIQEITGGTYPHNIYQPCSVFIMKY